MIIDAHTHLGDDRLYDSHRTEAELLKVMNRLGIDAIIVQTAQSPTIEISSRQHDRLFKFVKDNPGRAFALSSVNPNYDLDVYFAELHRCIYDYGFVGMKIAPHTYSWNPLVQRGIVPFLAADTFDVPLMIHTGTGLPFSAPTNLYYRLKDFPHVKVVLAHAGGDYWFEDDVLMMAKACPNVFLETSRGPSIPTLRRFIKELGPERVLLGSDSPDEMDHVLWMYRHAGLTDEELEWCLGRSAQELFKLHLS
jgi:predicted TIM-barrel fold metal-dependent hydrolase